MLRIDMNIVLQVRGPLLTKSSAPGPYGLDESVARNSDGKMYIPASHLAGKLREAWEELADCVDASTFADVPTAKEINQLLGKPSADNWEPQTKQLIFSDFILCAARDPQDGVGHRIRIDETSGAVRKGALLALETPYGAGAELEFQGTLSCYCRSEAQARAIQGRVQCGLQWVTQIGGMRGIGFGVLVAATTSHYRARKITVKKRNWSSDTGFDISIKPESPFCIAGRSPVNNLFVSEEIIPGNVILGMLAAALNRLHGNKGGEINTVDEKSPFALLQQHFKQIRITHAFPSADCRQRPVYPPESLVKASDLYDAALLASPCLINNQPPEFSVDWKDRAGVDDRFGWPSLRRELRVRTAIDSELLRSEEEKLFAYELVVPDSHSWQARVDLSRIPDPAIRRQLMNLLAALLEPGLLGLGKTKTPARVLIHEQDRVQPSRAIDALDGIPGRDDLLIITLQTPALLCSTENLSEASGANHLRDAYRETWRDLCPDLELIRYFARQSLAGGEYQYHRFQSEPGEETPYTPWLLTESGAVFVFRLLDRNRALPLVENWLTGGLPLAAPVRRCYHLADDPDNHWQKTPYTPQNGFGEIAVNLPDHRDLFPEEEICTFIPQPGEAGK